MRVLPKRGSDAVWVLVMFDLPTKTAADRRNASGFRRFLVNQGFFMAQLSVYVKHLPAAGRLLSLGRAVKANLPPGGLVQILSVSDRQWSNSPRFSNNSEVKTEEPPEQLTIF